MALFLFGRNFASENAAPGRMWVQGGGIKLANTSCMLPRNTRTVKGMQ